MINNYSTLSPLICNAKKSSFVSSRTMPFPEEDKIIIKHYRQNYGWGSRKVFSRIGNGKPWTRVGIQHLIEKIDKTGSHQRIKGSDRPRSARSKENITEVEGMFHRVKAQNLTEKNHHKRMTRAKRVLRYFTREKLQDFLQ